MRLPWMCVRNETEPKAETTIQQTLWNPIKMRPLSVNTERTLARTHHMVRKIMTRRLSKQAIKYISARSSHSFCKQTKWIRMYLCPHTRPENIICIYVLLFICVPRTLRRGKVSLTLSLSVSRSAVHRRITRNGRNAKWSKFSHAFSAELINA